MSRVEVRALDSTAALARDAAALFVAAARAARKAARRRFNAVLSAGPVSCLAWAALAEPGMAAEVVWAEVRIFPAEERSRAYNSPESSFRRLYLSLGSRVPLSPGGLGRLWGEGEDPDVVAGYGAMQLRDVAKCDEESIPRLDLLVLEASAEGLFPALVPSNPHEPLVTFAREAPTGSPHYVVGVPIVAAAACVIVLVPAHAAAPGLRDALARIRGDGETIVLVEGASADRL